MSETLEIFGREYTGVTGIKAKDDNGNLVTFIKPEGTLNVSENGTVDVSQYASANVDVSGGGSGVIVEPLQYLVNSHYYVSNKNEFYYSDAVETVVSYRLEVNAHYILSLNGSPGPRFRRVMFDNEPFTTIPADIPAPGSGEQVAIQTNGVNVGGTSGTENPAAYANYAFTATRPYLGVHLSLNSGDRPVVYLFKIV